jgi:glycosyltransferase involved in cell wall biosynthesis
MSGRLRYVAVTAARDEALNLPRLANSLSLQTVRPVSWWIVENGSADDTFDVAKMLSAKHDWVTVHRIPGTAKPTRGEPIVQALHEAVAAIEHQPPDILVNLDADVSFDPEYFDRLLAEFEGEALLGIASGTCHEFAHGAWRPRHVTGTSVWGAARAYRWDCLHDVLPLEERFAWDGIDEIKANARGWRTSTIPDLPFRHHRAEGARDESGYAARKAQGRAAHYMGYRPSYLLFRALRHLSSDPTAVAMALGYATAAFGRESRCSDLEARAYLRRQQRLRHLRIRMRETFGRTSAASS